MKYYPIFLNLRGKKCLVVGGGKVAQRKAEMLVRAGAKVTVISPQLTAPLRRMARRKKLLHVPRKYRRGGLSGFFLVYGATDDPNVQSLVAREAQRKGILVNIVDRPGLCNFIAPAIVQRGDLTLAVSTGGASPALAKKLRRDLERAFGAEYDKALRLLAALRQELGRPSVSIRDRRRIFTALVNSPLLRHLKRGESGKVKRLLFELTGRDWNLRDLKVRL